MKQVLVIIATVLMSSTAFAQNGADLHGRVTDQRNANVVGAEVRLRSRTGGQMSANTDDSGAYAFKNVAPGEYVLEIKMKGFATFTSKSLRVERGHALTSDVQLSVETVSESVIITATGTAQRTDEVSKAVTVLQDQGIESRREFSLPEALRGTPGLRVQQQGSPGTIASLRFRG